MESGDELITDRAGAVDIRLEDKSLLRVGSNSSYRLEENSSTHQFIHRLISGIVRVLVPKGEKAAAMKLEVRTAEGTIGVRGTEFVVIRNGSATELKGLEGEVTFGPADASFADTAKFVPVRGGFESRVANGAAKPSEPVAFDLPAYLKSLDSPEGPFKALVKRAKAVVKARSNAPAAPTAMVVAPVAAPKPSIKVAAKAEAKVPAAKNDPSMQLYQAALIGHVETMRAALKAGAAINKTQTVNKISPLQAAVLSDNPAAVAFLIDNKAEVNARDALGRTPLMTLASEGGVTTMVVALLDKGADPSLVDSDGMTAQALADESVKNAKDEKTRKMFQEISDALPDVPAAK
ncbi:MAG: hypothetical protein EOP11_01870 [Proteobacteria bacterium]|nr:MAG: hypothetical protein EOP11_01870 [Pseudomonadota bacterium]